MHERVPRAAMASLALFVCMAGMAMEMKESTNFVLLSLSLRQFKSEDASISLFDEIYNEISWHEFRCSVGGVAILGILHIEPYIRHDRDIRLLRGIHCLLDFKSQA
jgi:hypothetical protein